MKRKYHTSEQIVNKLREADAYLASGGTLEQVCKQLGISDATYYSWTTGLNGCDLSKSTKKQLVTRHFATQG